MKLSLEKNGVKAISMEAASDLRAKRTTLQPLLAELQASLAAEGVYVLTIEVSKADADAEAAALAKARAAMAAKLDASKVKVPA